MALIFLMPLGCTEASSPRKELVEVYANVVAARETMADSATIQRKIDSVIAAAGYTAEKLEKELRSMGATPQLFKSFYDSVSYKLTLLREKVVSKEKIVPAENKLADSVKATPNKSK